MELQDALVTLPHKRYGEYLEKVYAKMAKYIDSTDHVVEIGTRREDRGKISRKMLPYRIFETLDKNPSRAELVADIRNTPIRADVILSTCILHHLEEDEVPMALRNMEAPVLLFSGPTKEALPELFGDHRWHIEPNKLIDWLDDLGYRTFNIERIGMSRPYCEVFISASR